MSLMPVKERMTAAEFLALPPKEDAAIYELVAGEVIVNDPSLLHNAVQLNLVDALRDWSKAAEGRGRLFLPADVQVDEYTVLVPDLLWYRTGRIPDVHGAPPSPL